MCKCLGKTLFYPLNFIIVLVGISLFGFGCYNFIQTHAFNIFTISTLGIGVVLLLNSALLCTKGFKSKCLVGIYLFFLATLLLAETALAVLYFIPKYQKMILEEIPEQVKEEVKKNLLIARWMLLGLIGVQALTFLVGLALCRGIKNKDFRRQSERLLSSYDEHNYGSENANNSSRVRGNSYQQNYNDGDASNIPIASSYRAKHQHLYQKYNIQMDNQ